MLKFDDEFIFGTATSSFQIEGATYRDGRTPSIWDEFCKKPGKVRNGDTGDVACEHYIRYEEDIELIKELGVNSYRFSIAWPRIFPEQGVFNEAGMAFYRNLVIGLVDAGIKPVATLYHWDLPMWAYEKGGWLNRESVVWFLEYAQKCFEELDSYVDSWITHNEPWCASFLSYHLGVHAPGHRNIEEGLKAAHYILLSHGKVVEYYKNQFHGQKPIGITLNLAPVYSASESFEDQLAANNKDGYTNRWFLDAIFKGTYPADMVNLFSKQVHSFSFIEKDDLEVISIPCDFFGINYYARELVEFDSLSPTLSTEAYSNYPKTGMGWDVSPKEFKELIYRLRKEYTELPIYITENGAAYDDVLLDDGRVHDAERTKYLEEHLQAIHELNEDGQRVAGYYLWSLFDNFEWAFGYEKRFGIMYVDFNTQKRYWKDSARRYQEIVSKRELSMQISVK
ncbi:GH1 family beta-glucosidase [Alkalihalobacillus pseudalcaliphilus]|uniref:GH1 family beta-glucosidase n=1 Tax=Alkalihalobacillus pseudalcaliphilus TaxID=79884 RepID=UPI00064DBC4D|nr:GH1 family beta-glucosidase [Alkalihalobacillus pseudalcaliphilus]KMK76865.1 beta-glucosidase [Alkalihalobacillus pseudalcaliphilus]